MAISPFIDGLDLKMCLSTPLTTAVELVSCLQESREYTFLSRGRLVWAGRPCHFFSQPVLYIPAFEIPVIAG
jgi:hypothetical protein